MMMLKENMVLQDILIFDFPQHILPYYSKNSSKTGQLSCFVVHPGAASAEQKGPLSLGEQASLLRDPQDRLQALRRVTSTAQILLAYSMVMRALSQTSSR